MSEYPKMLYGKKGWSDLNDSRLVHSGDEEKAARKAGYAPLGPMKTPEEPKELETGETGNQEV